MMYRASRDGGERVPGAMGEMGHIDYSPYWHSLGEEAFW